MQNIQQIFTYKCIAILGKKFKLKLNTVHSFNFYINHYESSIPAKPSTINSAWTASGLTNINTTPIESLHCNVKSLPFTSYDIWSRNSTIFKDHHSSGLWVPTNFLFFFPKTETCNKNSVMCNFSSILHIKASHLGNK